MRSANFLGFGAGRKIILSAIFWITLVAHLLTYLVLFIFFCVAISSDTVAAAWYLYVFYSFHLVATGVFIVATLDGVQPGVLFTKASVIATVLMTISIVLNLVAGYFYIIDLWLPCITGVGPSLNSAQQNICNNERLSVWVLFVGAIILLFLPIAGFVAALWDSLVQMRKSRQFASLSAGFGQFGSGLRSLARNVSGGQKYGEFYPIETEGLGMGEGEYATEADMYRMGKKMPVNMPRGTASRAKPGLKPQGQQQHKGHRR